jgi:hypothetical protein
MNLSCLASPGRRPAQLAASGENRRRLSRSRHWPSAGVIAPRLSSTSGSDVCEGMSLLCMCASQLGSELRIALGSYRNAASSVPKYITGKGSSGAMLLSGAL